ncbi:hypothetical protein IEN85_10540 [Pelagicoccus sp. NFK12]|uniref:Uncharacterized protein n=1 Tax=Pelagicoccus enzymogenes TaxID=2773457 RepID=A0A927IH82_9BACT|nr:hypothetical protein [Pelagicoccus enzymogenes]MBD5779926.1 hypothetical protein [Pelagicoccus enzymogenes]
MKLNNHEQEVIALCVIVEALDNTVNHSLLDVRPDKETPNEVFVYFHDYIHRDLFLIRTLDITKEKVSKNLLGIEGSCIDALHSICQQPSFSKYDSINNLRLSVERIKDWLNKSKTVKLWLPSLNIDASIEVTRLELLTISGNTSKHNISRLTGVCSQIHKILDRNGYKSDFESMPFALEDFEEHLNGNYFIYYGTQLSELLNNLRWGIQDYLLPLFRENHKISHQESGDYHFTYPNEINDKLAKEWFWRLLNLVRRKPYFEKFRSSRYLNEESSLETKR